METERAAEGGAESPRLRFVGELAEALAIEGFPSRAAAATKPSIIALSGAPKEAETLDKLEVEELFRA
jgi:hypothetical protein